jgi:ferrochelatase
LGDIDVIAPGFAADSPETLEEIAIRYAGLYRSHGGGELRYSPALNDSPRHIKALASVLRRHLRGWAPGPRIS